jgi:hypothetical protein
MNKIRQYTGPADCPQAGRERVIMPQPIALLGLDADDVETALLDRVRETGAVFMMGQNPALAVMPEKPRLLDFFKYRFFGVTGAHLLRSAKLALGDGHDEKVVMACLLHDIASGALLRTDHGYWGAQMIAPYVSAEIAWAVKYHQALRYFADETVGYAYPRSYDAFLGADYRPPEYICRDHAVARQHRWYMTSRLITVYDIYSFEEGESIDPDLFTDIIGRHFKEPEEGLGFDDSPTAHMWRTMIWPNNLL